MDGLYPHTWPAAQLDQALEGLARHAGLRAEPGSAPPSHLPDGAALGRYVAATAGRLGLEAEAVTVPYGDVAPVLRAAAPALLRLDLDGETRFAALVRGGRRHAGVLGPDLQVRRVPLAGVFAALCAGIERPAAAEVERLLVSAGLPRGGRARAALLRERLGGQPVEGVWILHLPPSAPFLAQLRRAGLVRGIAGLLAVCALQQVVWVLSWYVVGLAALQGRLDGGWLAAWVLLLAALVPLRLRATRQQGDLTVRAGVLVRRRLLLGALKLDLDVVRRQGVGQLLGRILESNTVEALALNGGLGGLLAVLELAAAAVVLALGAGGWPQAGLLAAWIGLAGVLAMRLHRRQGAATATRLDLTHRLVERMVGHRTRLAQQRPDRWHHDEDRDTEHYLDLSAAADRAETQMRAFVPRGWLVVGCAALAPTLGAGAPDPLALALALGGLLLAFHAFRRLTAGAAQVSAAVLAWGQVAGLFAAAARPDARASVPAVAAALPPPARPGETVLEAHDVGFGYGPGSAPVLQAATFRIASGDRLLLEGPSGSGKSTLSAVLTGLRQPQAGLLLLHGLDRASLGLDAWRARVAAAPQFHENHVLAGTFAFNLLMGRSWPPTAQDLAEAEALCRALGLGDLLDRMPAGLHQMVGETGWQLSHGERSRLFLARALLQQADLVVLDESFGALDPENLGRTMRCVLDRASTLLVIAHP